MGLNLLVRAADYIAVRNLVLLLYIQDHITLLLSCYTKVKDEAQISALLDAIAVNPHIKDAHSKHSTLKHTQVTIDGSGNYSQFNPEQAIVILDTAGYTGKRGQPRIVSVC